jgi:polyhydroxyalkanoate synthesis regulator phasin
MAEQKTDNKDLLARLRDAGEDALQKVGDLPGGQKMLDAMNGMRDRIDELQKRMKRVDELEKRVAALEKKVAGTATRSTTRKRTTASRSSGSTSPPKTKR